MVQNRTVIDVLDNSGVQKVRVIQVRGQKKFGSIGDQIVGSAIKVKPDSRFKKGDLVKGLIVQTRKNAQSGAIQIKFNRNSCIILTNKGDPVGSRINGVIPNILRSRGYSRILLLARKRI
jgi:large subunit ribosomal protein L14